MTLAKSQKINCVKRTLSPGGGGGGGSNVENFQHFSPPERKRILI